MKHLNWINVSVLAVALIAIGCFSYQNLFCDNCGTDTLSSEATVPVIQTPPVIESADPAPTINPEPVDERQAANDTPRKTTIEAVLANFNVSKHDRWQGKRSWLNQNEDAARWKYSAVNKQEWTTSTGGPFIWTEITENSRSGQRNLVLNVMSSRNACKENKCGPFKIWHAGMPAGIAFGGDLVDSKTHKTRKELKIVLDSDRIDKLRTALKADEFYVEYGEGELEVIPELKTAMLQTIYAYDRILKTDAMPYEANIDDSAFADKWETEFRKLDNDGILSHFEIVEHQRMKGLRKYVNLNGIVKQKDTIWLEIDEDMRTDEFRLVLNVRSKENECDAGTCRGLEFFRTGWSKPRSIHDSIRLISSPGKHSYEWIPYRAEAGLGNRHKLQIVLHPKQVEMLKELLTGNRAFIKTGINPEREIDKPLRRRMLKTVIAFQRLTYGQEPVSMHDLSVFRPDPNYRLPLEKWMRTSDNNIVMSSKSSADDQNQSHELRAWLEVRMMRAGRTEEANLVMHIVPNQRGCVGNRYWSCHLDRIALSWLSQSKKFGSHWHRFPVGEATGFKTTLDKRDIRILRKALIESLQNNSTAYLGNYETKGTDGYVKKSLLIDDRTSGEMLSVLDAYSRNSLTDIPVQNASHIRRIR